MEVFLRRLLGDLVDADARFLGDEGVELAAVVVFGFDDVAALRRALDEINISFVRFADDALRLELRELGQALSLAFGDLILRRRRQQRRRG